MKREGPGSYPWKAGYFGAYWPVGGDEMPSASLAPGY